MASGVCNCIEVLFHVFYTRRRKFREKNIWRRKEKRV
jgi:hypothetical protein